MQLARPLLALDPKLFGRGRVRELASVEAAPGKPSSDLKLFVATFAAGFLFTSIFIA